MKKREFVLRMEHAIGYDRYSPATLAAVRLAEEAGATWDPEEPELPRRISFGTGFTGLKLIEPTEDGAREAEEETYREAAARYNAVERCEREGRFGEFFTVLDEEREKLA